MGTCRMNKYSNYEDENVAIYTKIKTEKEERNDSVVDRVEWMKIELERFNVNIVEFVDRCGEGEYKEINRLIELVKKDEIKAILIWDVEDIPLKTMDNLAIECRDKNIYLNGFLTPIKMK